MRRCDLGDYSQFFNAAVQEDSEKGLETNLIIYDDVRAHVKGLMALLKSRSDDSQVIILFPGINHMADLIVKQVLDFDSFRTTSKSIPDLVNFLNSPVGRGPWVESVQSWGKLVGFICLMLRISFYLVCVL
jgi:hypothetical protein